MKTSASQGVFLTTEGFDATVIDSQVVDLLVALQEQGVVLQLLSLVDGRTWWSRRDYYRERAREIQARLEGRVALHPLVRKRQALGRALGAGWLRAAAPRSGTPVFHARGDWAAWIAAAAKGSRARVIFDVRGDSEAEFRMEARDRGFSEAEREEGLARIESARRAACAGADHVLCVSEPLRTLVRERFGVPGEGSSVIPCAADPGKFHPDEADRDAVRARLGFEDDFVIVFPGRLGRWHASREMLAVVAELMATDPAVRFLCLTPDLDEGEALARASLPEGRFRVLRAAHHEVPSYLRASDLGLLLRERDPVNAVACPTKFAEFVMTGLPVLISADIGDCSAFVARHGAGGVLEDLDPAHARARWPTLRGPHSASSRATLAEAGREAFSRPAHTARLVELYRGLGVL